MGPRAASVCALAVLACASPPEPDPAYAPTRGVLEVASLLRLHVDDDTYRFPPARDVTGKNVYRSAFQRLESLEEIHSDKFASGYLLDVIWFAKGRALERLGEFELAASPRSRTRRRAGARCARRWRPSAWPRPLPMPIRKRFCHSSTTGAAVSRRCSSRSSTRTTGP
jgi:hypothetical protein